MEVEGNGGHAALVQLQAYLAQQRPAGRQPPAAGARALRESSASRAATCARRWRCSRRRARSGGTSARAPSSAAGRSRRRSRSPKLPARTNPADVMRARLDPRAGDRARGSAARHTRRHRRDAALACCRRAQPRPGGNTRTSTTCSTARSPRRAATPCSSACSTSLNAIRRAVVWGRLRTEPARPPADHHSFAEHERIVDAIEDRDLGGAARRMRAPSAVGRAPLDPAPRSRRMSKTLWRGPEAADWRHTAADLHEGRSSSTATLWQDLKTKGLLDTRAPNP